MDQQVNRPFPAPTPLRQPQVAVRDVLRLALPPGTQVIGGAAGLDHTVSWACLVQLDPPNFDRIEGGELALASLVDPVDAPHARLAAVLQTLGLRGVAALALAGSIPPGAQALADAANIPLLALPRGVRLGEIEKAVIAVIVNRRAELEQRGVQIYRQLAQHAIENRGIAAIVETLAEIVDKPVTVEDEQGNLEVCASPPDRPISSDELIAALRDPGGLETWLVNVPLSSTSPPIARRALAAPGWARFVAPIIVGGAVVGYLSILGPNDELDELDGVAAGRGASVCAIEIAKRQAISDAEKRIRSDFLDDLFSGRITNEAALISRGQPLGLDPSRSYVVVIFEVDTSAAYLEWLSSQNEHYVQQLRQTFGRAINEELSRVVPGALVRVSGESAGALYPIALSDGELTMTKEQIEEIRQRVTQRLAQMTVSAGVGRLYPRLTEAHRGFREAEQALTVALRLFGTGRTTAFDDLGIYRLLFHLHGTAELSSFYEETLGRLNEHDARHAGELAATLKAFFTYHGNLSRTAEALYLHRNTVSYRLQRIEEITGLSLEREDDRFRLQLALKLRDIV